MDKAEIRKASEQDMYGIIHLFTSVFNREQGIPVKMSY